jgi:hypothetical protein
VTIVESPPVETKAADPQLLFREAKARRRRRWTIGGISIAVVSILAIGIIAGASQWKDQGQSSQQPAPLSAVGNARLGSVTGSLMLSAGVSAAGFHGLPGTVRLIGQHGQGTIVHVGSDGAFSVHLPPGRYLGFGSSPHFLSVPRMPCRGRSPIIVLPGRTSRVTVICEGM